MHHIRLKGYEVVFLKIECPFCGTIGVSPSVRDQAQAMSSDGRRVTIKRKCETGHIYNIEIEFCNTGLRVGRQAECLGGKGTLDEVDLFLESETRIWRGELGPREGARSGSMELYERYESWARRNGNPWPMSMRSFGSRLTEKGFLPAKSSTKRYRIGLTLKDADRQDDVDVN